MKVDEAIKQCNDLINDFKNNEEERVNATDILAIETVLKDRERIIERYNLLYIA